MARRAWPRPAAKGKPKVQNSVRDLAIAGNVLLVCDEPTQTIRLYALTDGTYLGSGPTCAKPHPPDAPRGGLMSRAGDQLYWTFLGDAGHPPRSISRAS